MAAYFGPGGNSDAFKLWGGKSTLDAPRFVKEIGLDAYEYEAGNGIASSPIMLSAIGKEAEKYGVNLGFENTEGEEYLEAILNRYSDSSRVGFCIDTGHEMCYNERRDLITKYGKQLICTHLNDNMGRTTDKITWHDDAHLLPFDGSADWQGIANRLNAVGYGSELTFELTSKSKPQRSANDIYNNLDYEGFVSLALDRAKKFAQLL